MSFTEEIKNAFNTAHSSPKGGSEQWKELLISYDIDPLSSDDKALLLDAGVKIGKGAFPVELRKLYEKIKEKYPDNTEAREFDIEAEIMSYHKRIKPPAALSSIFSNAAATSGKYSRDLKGEKHHTIRCKCCGASRLEEMQYDNCLFCGSKLFDNAN